MANAYAAGTHTVTARSANGHASVRVVPATRLGATATKPTARKITFSGVVTFLGFALTFGIFAELTLTFAGGI